MKYGMEKMSKAREMHSKKMDLKISRYVKDVVYPEKMEQNETAKIEDREISIYNYTNRAQKVGQ